MIQQSRRRIPLSSIEQFFNTLEEYPLHSEKVFGHFWAETQNSGPALLCHHRSHARWNVQPPYSLHQLMCRYQGFDCTDRRDKVYALFNLMGPTRKHLHVDYNATLPKSFVELFCFINRFESSPVHDVIGVAVLLAGAHGLLQGQMSLEIQARSDQKEAVDKMTVSLFVRGRIVRQLSSTAAEHVEASRQSVTGPLDFDPDHGPCRKHTLGGPSNQYGQVCWRLCSCRR